MGTRCASTSGRRNSPMANAPINLVETELPSARNASAADRLLENIKQQLPELEKMLANVESEWLMEDMFYRFYHQSFKVYAFQQTTGELCKILQNLLPERSLNEWFLKIVADGTRHEFEMSHNQDWHHHTRPILEAFFHAHYFLKMVVKHGRELQSAPSHLPCGWAAVLYLFNLRYELQ